MTNKTFHVSVPAADEELAADRLWELGVEAVGIGSEVDGRVELWTSVGGSPEAIERAAQRLEPGWTWHSADVVEPDETWRDHVSPTWYRADGVVVPAWWPAATEIESDDVLVTRIEPGTSFGLGDHPTTRLTMQALARHLDTTAPSTLLDVGCGSGVLGIIAAQRGVPVIRSTDVSAGAVEATIANAERNGVAAQVDADLAPLDTLTGPYDVVLANILAPVLVSLARELRRLTAAGGVLIVSGILADEHDHVLRALRPMRVEATTVTDGWAAVSLRH